MIIYWKAAIVERSSGKNDPTSYISRVPDIYCIFFGGKGQIYHIWKRSMVMKIFMITLRLLQNLSNQDKSRPCAFVKHILRQLGDYLCGVDTRVHAKLHSVAACFAFDVK
jgi:hypothetical protein